MSDNPKMWDSNVNEESTPITREMLVKAMEPKPWTPPVYIVSKAQYDWLLRNHPDFQWMWMRGEADDE